MLNIKKFMVITGLIMSIRPVNAQILNWESLNDQAKNTLNVSLGFEFGLIYGVGYGHQLKTKNIPVMATLEFSIPSGNVIKDDFKTKIGGQVSWLQVHNFQISTRIQGIFRKYCNDFVRLVNFGSDMAGTIGYYRHSWFVSFEGGFDKAIVTHFKHSTTYKEQYSGVVDGWYKPSTGGNFYYGLQMGFSFKQNDLYLTAGKIISQDFKTSPLFPFYIKLGYNLKF